jgi:aspartyl-tRNA(Asn)/glutamyl-tRNA(Gln) amidotransferase subunit C
LLVFSILPEELNRSIMALTNDDIRRIAHLARLEFSVDQSNKLLSQINDFFKIVEQIEAVHTEGVIPLAHPVELLVAVSLRLREDRISESNERDAHQQSAPAVERGLYLVPRVVE